MAPEPRPGDRDARAARRGRARVWLDWEGRRDRAPARPASLRLIARLGDGGEGTGGGGGADRLVLGDNLEVMDALLAELAGRVRLVYADPPFGTGADYHRSLRLDGAVLGPGVLEPLQYADRWEEPEYLQFLADRLPRMRDLLAPDGVLVLHVGGAAAAAVRLLGDEVFGSRRLINEVSWVRASAHSDRRQGAGHMGRVHDRILIWGRTARARLRPVYRPYDPTYVERFYRHVEPGTGRRYALDNLVAPGGASRGNPRYEVMGVARHWRYSRERMAALVEEGRVVQTAPGRVPRYKRYLDEMPGRPVQDVWDDVAPLGVRSAERVGFPTQKPLALLRRVIELGSDPGDLVLDPFAGSGTTLVAARDLGRRAIGVDASAAALWTAVVRCLERPAPPVRLWCQEGREAWRSCGSGEVAAHLEEREGDVEWTLRRFAPRGLRRRLADAGWTCSDHGLELVERLAPGTVDDDGVLHLPRVAAARGGGEGPDAVSSGGGASGRPALLIIDRALQAHLHKAGSR